MLRQMTEGECQEFLAEPHVGVLSVASDSERSPLTWPVRSGRRLRPPILPRASRILPSRHG